MIKKPPFTEFVKEIVLRGQYPAYRVTRHINKTSYRVEISDGFDNLGIHRWLGADEQDSINVLDCYITFLSGELEKVKND